MKNINYKIVSIVLFGILLVTYAWHWDAIFLHNTNSSSISSNKKNTHIMRMPDGSMMEMSNSDMNTGGGMMDMTMSDMVKMMEGKSGKALEKEFITGMIPHHQGAVDMAKKLLTDKTISPELKKFAESIIAAQEGEIKQMNNWLKSY